MSNPRNASDAAASSSASGNADQFGARRAYLFKCPGFLAVTLNETGGDLPRDVAAPGKWTAVRPFNLGVHDAGLLNMDAERLLAGLAARGVYVWRSNLGTETDAG